MMSNNVCPVCGKADHHLAHRLRNGQLLQCRSCSLIFFAPRPTLEELQSFYESHEYREAYNNSPMGNIDFAQNRYDELYSVMSVHGISPPLQSRNQTLGKWLDVGCGTGDLLKIATHNGWDVTGTEMSSLAAQKANLKLDSKVFIGDITSLTLPENTYDIITSYHVIEHLLDPIQMLKRLYALVKPGGFIFIETPNIGSLGAKIRGSKWSHITPPEHITYFQPSSLKYALDSAGFHNFIVFTRTPQVIESTKKLPFMLKPLALKIYDFAPRVGLGAALQALAFKY